MPVVVRCARGSPLAKRRNASANLLRFHQPSYRNATHPIQPRVASNHHHAHRRGTPHEPMALDFLLAFHGFLPWRCHSISASISTRTILFDAAAHSSAPRVKRLVVTT